MESSKDWRKGEGARTKKKKFSNDAPMELDLMYFYAQGGLLFRYFGTGGVCKHDGSRRSLHF